MRVIRINGGLTIENVVTKGQPPEGRIGHSMHYYHKASKIIIYGGKNDRVGIFSDAYVFDPKESSWLKISYQASLLK